jgi:hypothetical protein
MFDGREKRKDNPQPSEGEQGMVRVVTLALAVGLVVGAVEAHADDSSGYLSIQGGAFSFDDDDTEALLGAQYRFGQKLWIVNPMVGGFVTTDGGLYGYAGITHEFDLGDHVLIRPAFAVGAYSHGDGRDLGGALEFRSALELGWRFDGGSSVGLEISHISNAGIYDDNPGVENLTLNYTLPLN